jgi:membrane-bound lytic murein transglycosylase F
MQSYQGIGILLLSGMLFFSAHWAEAGILSISTTGPRLKAQTIPYESIIKKYAKHYGFDWRLIAAQIKQESGFKANARNRTGAKGLLQLMPATASAMKIKDTTNPRENIAGGVHYLRTQYDIYTDVPDPHRLMFALASYNCGAGRIFDSRDLARYEQLPPDQWEAIELSLPKLSPQYKDLHQKVWKKEKPRYGYFKGCRETINYVENIWVSYEAYQKTMI